MSWSRFLSIVLVAGLPGPVLLAQKEHGFDNRKPSGQSYLSPAESVKRFQIPPEYEVTVWWMGC